MTPAGDRTSRRNFVSDVGRLASTVALTACASPSAPRVAAQPAAHAPPPSRGEWDLSWIGRLASATDRAVFDWPSIGDPADPITIEIAARYLDNCAAAYRPQTYDARVVLNIRTQAVPAALTDALWTQYALGVEYSIKDPVTQQPATRNPFWHRAPSPAPGITLPNLEDMVNRGAIILVCDFALGHLATRLATKAGRAANDVHRELRDGFVPGSFAVPSGMFGLARAQNSGCAYMHV
jgi:hypothetical protein